MKYLVPALSSYLVTVITKHPQYAMQHVTYISQIAQHLLTTNMRMEQPSLQISQAVFEKIGLGFDNGEFLKNVLMGIF